MDVPPRPTLYEVLSSLRLPDAEDFKGKTLVEQLQQLKDKAKIGSALRRELYENVYGVYMSKLRMWENRYGHVAQP
jgi:hypothetical protein